MKKIAILSSGLDARKDRGYENSSMNLFNNLSEEDPNAILVHLYKGSGERKRNQYVVKSFANRKWVRKLGNKKYGDSFVFEYIIFALFYIFYNWFNRRKYDAIYTQEPRTAKTLYQLKFLLVGKPEIIFGMGVKMTPEHYINICDRCHVVNYEYFQWAEEKYPGNKKVFLIPNPGSEQKTAKGFDKEEVRKDFGIKTSKVVLAVGAINKAIKNMDYVVDEAAKLDDDWTLVLCGKKQESWITERAEEKLGDRFIHLFVSPDEISKVYVMADVLVLASFVEGFPNVVLEGGQNGVAPILHDRLLNEWALGGRELLVDMSKEGALSEFISCKEMPWFDLKGKELQEYYEKNYSWNALKKPYLELLLGNKISS